MGIKKSIVTLIASAAILSCGLSSSGLAADVQRGHDFATKHCGTCHALGREGESPVAKAPPFRSLGEKYPVESLAESLAEGIVTGHADMPEFVLSPEEIGDFLAYLESLQPSAD